MSNSIKIICSQFLLLLIVPFSNVKGQQVDLLTGRPTVTIPLGAVSSGNLSASIGLSYGINGIKSEQREGSAGMGWDLSVGGSVSRSVRGLPDDYEASHSGIAGDTRNGWLYGNLARQVGDFNAVPENSSAWSTLSQWMSSVDMEPDLFTVSAPGLYAQFFFDNDKIVRTTPYQDLKIVFERDVYQRISTFTITNNLGVKYTFAEADIVTRKATKIAAAVTHLKTYFDRYEKSVRFSGTWSLTSITAPSGALLTFQYESICSRSQPEFVRVVNSVSNTVEDHFKITDDYTFKQLTSVQGANESVFLKWTGGLIGSIQFMDKTYNDWKVVQFTYGMAESNFTTESRSFLKAVTESIGCDGIASTKFTYYGLDLGLSQPKIDLPFDLKIKQDLFGYYNSTGTSLVPEVYIGNPDTQSGGERFRIASASGYSLLASGGSRAVNASVIHTGMLSKIETSIGGYTNLYYEPSEYLDDVTGTTQYGAGVRVKKTEIGSVGSSSIITNDYVYKLTNGKSSGRWTYPPMFAYADGNGITRVPENLSPEEGILYSRVEVSSPGKGRVVYDYHIPGVYPQTAVGDFAATQSIIIEHDWLPKSLGNLRSGYYTFPYPRSTNFGFEQGLIKRISNYTSAGLVVSRVQNTYQRTTLPVISVYGLQAELTGNGNAQLGKYKLLGDVGKLVQTQVSRLYDPMDTLKFTETQQTYVYNNKQMVSELQTTSSTNVQLTKHFRYAYDYNPTGAADIQSQMINGLITNNQQATLIESYTKNAGQTIGGELTLFSTYGTRILPSQQLKLLETTTFNPSTITGGLFSKSDKYRPVWFADSYDVIGNITGYHGQSRIATAVIMGYNNALPIAEVRNASLTQVAYTEFEPMSAGAIQFESTQLRNTDKWSGKYSYELSTGFPITVTVQKADCEYYRIALRAKATTASDIAMTIKLNGANIGTVIYPASASNTWSYLEQRVNVSALAANASLSIEIASTVAILLDNFAAYPETAQLVAHSFDPLKGKTADLDSRGGAVFQDYDQFGRPQYIRDQDKNIVAITEYRNVNSIPASINSNFSFSQNITSNTLVGFFAPTAQCVSGTPTYTWYVDGVQSGSGTSFYKQFTSDKNYIVKLKVEIAGLGQSETSATVRPIMVLPEPSTPDYIYISLGSLVVTGGGTQFDKCEDSKSRDFSIAVTGMDANRPKEYIWQFSNDESSWQQLLPGENLYLDNAIASFGGGSTLSLSAMPLRTFWIRVVVKGEKYNSTTSLYDRVEGTSAATQFTPPAPGGPPCH